MPPVAYQIWSASAASPEGQKAQRPSSWIDSGSDTSAGSIVRCDARTQIHSMSDTRSIRSAAFSPCSTAPLSSALQATRERLGHGDERRAEELVGRLAAAAEPERFVQADRGEEERRRAEVHARRAPAHREELELPHQMERD